MATINNVKERFALALGVSEAVLERQLRALREAQLTPTGRPGGRTGSAHYSALHLAYVLLGFAAARLSEAPDAVRKLRGLIYRGCQNPPDDVAPPLGTLEDQLADWIDSFGIPYRKGMQWLPESLVKIRSWEMQLCLDPCHAIIKYGVSEPKTIYVYAANPTPVPALRRFTVLTGEVLIAAAEMLADTEIQQNALNAVLFLDATKPTRLGLEHENAGSLAGEPAPRRAYGVRNDQCDFKSTDQECSLGGDPTQVTMPKRKPECDNTQGFSDCILGHSFQPEGSTDHELHSGCTTSVCA